MKRWRFEKALEAGIPVVSDGTHIDAVLAQNDEMALGATEAIKSAGKQDEIKVLGIDGIEDVVLRAKLWGSRKTYL